MSDDDEPAPVLLLAALAARGRWRELAAALARHESETERLDPVATAEARGLVALAEGRPAAALLTVGDDPRLVLLRARAMALLARNTDEVWQLLASLPRALLEQYARRHADEPAAAVARRILDDGGAYR